MMYGITFDGKHTYDDFGLCCLSVEIGLPKAKKKVVDLKGADGVIDLSGVFGRTLFGNRKLKFKFDRAERNWSDWAVYSTQLANYLHGQRRKIILDNDQNYYYYGLVTLKISKKMMPYSDIIIEVDADPYKREHRDAMTYCWNWDAFSFVDGIIREYGNIVVDGEYTLIVFGSEMPVVPTIYCSTAMTAVFNGKEYALHAGENKLYGEAFLSGAQEITFIGNGTVSVSYRGGRI